MSISHHQYYPSVQGASALDFNVLDSLRHRLHTSSKLEDTHKRIAHEFEALMIQQWLRVARQAERLSAVHESAQLELGRSLRDEQMALQLSDPGLGLAQALLTQIRGGAQSDSVRQDRLAGGIAALPGSGTVALSALRPASMAGRVVAVIRDAPRHVSDFVARMSDAAKQASQRSGVPAKLMLSQAALESGWGRREIRYEDGSNSYNLFGIKADAGWKGKVASVVTTEYLHGKAHKLVQRFRAYASYAESFSDYARLISMSPRYRQVMQADSAEIAARRIQEAGYATDPAYARKLISIMAYFDEGQRSAQR